MTPSKKKPAATQSISIKKRVLSPEDERASMYAANEAQVERAGFDETLDKENEKRFLAEFRLNNPKLAPFIGELQPYVRTFPDEFYTQIYRLNGWLATPEKLQNRPGIVGAWTIELVYERYPIGMVQELRTRNHRLPNGELLHKHFQFLTTEGIDQLKAFIQEAIDLMMLHSTWAGFRNAFARKCGKPWQASLFDNTPE